MTSDSSDNTRSVPGHVAIIMDGNGRWAQRRGLPRAVGHKKGADAVEHIVRAADDLGIQYLTLFAFSTENWHRPEEEVNDLMGLLRLYLKSKMAEMHRNGVKLQVIGDRTRLATDILELINHAEELTRRNTGVQVNIALSYSGRWDVTQACRAIAMDVQDGMLATTQINEALVSKYMATANIPDADLLIRTSGEQRISNFMLWQCAYAELHFTDVLWPDFKKEDLEKACGDYVSRDRRFGARVASV